MKDSFFGGIIFCGLLISGDPANAQSWNQTMAPSNYWTSIVASADGTRLAALAGSACYVSINAGTTWSSNAFPTTVNGSILAASADGMHLVAATDNSGEI